MQTLPDRPQGRRRRFDALCHWLERGTLIAAGSLLVVMLVVAWMHVFRRYVMNDALSWSEEFLRFSLVWFALLSASIIFKHRAHLGLVFLVQKLPAALQGRIDRAIRWLMLVLTAFVAYQGLVILWGVRGQVTPALRLPVWLPYSAIPVSFILMAIYGVWHLVSPGPYEQNAGE
jgi:TRAP-type transport system small permease protein